MAAGITAALLHDLVTCPHRVTMDLHGDAAQRGAESPLLSMLWARRTAHEPEVAASLELELSDLSALAAGAREEATARALAEHAPLIYGACIRAGDLLATPDLLRLDDGGYVAGDIRATSGEDAGKLRRSYAMQLALCTDVLERRDLSAGRYGFIVDGRGEETVYELDAPRGPRTPLTLWQEYRKLLAQARELAARGNATRPALCEACSLCVWREPCLSRLERDDDLSLLPEVSRTTRDLLARRFPTVASLAGADPDELDEIARKLEGVGATQLRRIYERARLASEHDARAYRRGELPLPAAAQEIFLDAEVDPLRDHCYLHGFLERGAGARMRYRGFFAEDASEEAEETAFAAAWQYLSAARDAAVYHYGAHARAAWRTLQERYPHVCDTEEVEELFAAEETVDLYSSVVRPRTEWPTRDYSMRSIATHLGFRWRDEAAQPTAAVEWYEAWLGSRDEALRKRILAANEDDCRAAAQVLDALRALDPSPWAQ